MADATATATATATITREDRVTGCLYGGAAGDALGAPIEFMSWADVARCLGRRGVSRPVKRRGPHYWTDDTQMTLFTVEGLARAWRGAGTNRDRLVTSVANAYVDWRLTQSASPANWVDAATGQLAHHEALWRRAAPGATCLTALSQLAAADGFEWAANDSKGCGGVMRVAPAGLLPLADDQEAFELGADLAAITHAHVDGWEPAGALAVIIRALVEGASPEAAIQRALAQLHRRSRTAVLLRAVLALNGQDVRPTTLVKHLGEGWVGDECLAVAAHALLVADQLGGDVAEGLRVAVNHDGDSDSTGAVAGNLLGAAFGGAALPGWVRQLADQDLLDWAVQAVSAWA